MFGPGNDNADYRQSRHRQAAQEGPVRDSGSSNMLGGGLATLSRLVESASSGASYNAPVRAEAMRGMQGTYGNRAVQRAIAGASLPVQRSTYADQWTVPPIDPRDYLESAKQFGSDVSEEASFQSGRFMDTVADTRSSVGGVLGRMAGLGPKEEANTGLFDTVMGIGKTAGGVLLNGWLGNDKPNTRDMALPLAGIPFLGAPDMRGLLDYGHEMEGGGTGFGWEPSKDGGMPRPHAYAKVNEYGGQEMGGALLHGEGKVGGLPTTTDLLYGVDKQGTFETDNGDTRYGALQNGGLTKTQFNQGGVVSGDMEALTGGFEASAGTDGATLNAGYNIVAGSITGGQPTDASQTDAQARFGLSAGLSGALRGHWGDKDEDGHPEYGVGVDAGIFSADLKTEDPVGGLVRGAIANNPFTSGPASMLFNQAYGETNMTDAVGSGLSSVGSGIGSAWDWMVGTEEEHGPWDQQ